MPEPTPPEVRSEIVRRYEGGESSVVLSKSLSIGITTVLNILKRNGIRPAERLPGRARKAQKLTPDIQSSIIAQYEAGSSLSMIAKAHGVVIGTVHQFLKRKGVPRRNRGNTYKRLAECKIQQMASLWHSGVSQTEIGKQFGLTQSNISMIFENVGITKDARRPRRERHGAWKGGRGKQQNGYVYVRVELEDPMRIMANVGGYVFEHRIVMARALGRPLHKWETVHHIDGDKTNNTLGNLQLHIGQHGNAVVYECACCGSRRLNAVEI